jgi:hypothetical protein
MTNKHELADRLEDPVRFLCEDAINAVRPRKLALMSAWVMGRLPFSLPLPAVKYVSRGVKQELTLQMKREVQVGRERQRRMVPVDGEWQTLNRSVLAEYAAFINDLKESSQKDRRRIRFHEQEYDRFQKIAQQIPGGEHLTLEELRAHEAGEAA